MDFPLFLFPSDPLTFGKSSSAFVRDGAANFQVSSIPRLEVVNDWHQIAPKTRVCDRSIPVHNTEKYIDSMINYYHANYIRELIPFPTLAELLKEEISSEQQLDIYDPYAGNALYIHQFDTGAQLWLYASGEAMNVLRFAYFTDGLFDPSIFRFVEFNTPIRQIAGIHGSKHLVAVRSWDGVTFFEVQIQDSSLNLQLLNSHRFLRPPFHVEWHQVLYGHAAIRLEDGACYIWDITKPETDRLKCIYKGHSEAQSCQSTWKSCTFGSHPKVVLLAEVDHLNMLDTRSKSELKLLEKTDTRYYSVAKDPLNCFHLAISSKRATDLIDLRYLKAPMMKLEFQDERDIFLDLKFIRSDNRYLFAWESKRGNSMLYELESSEKCGYFPPCIRSVQNLASFKDHMSRDQLPFNPVKTSHQHNLWDNENHPVWPNLIGCVPLFLPDQRISLNQLYQDGSIYSISYCDKSHASQDHYEPYINSLDYIQEEESKVFREYLESKNLFKTSEYLNFSYKPLNISRVSQDQLIKEKSEITSPPLEISNNLSSIQEYYLERWKNYDQYYVNRGSGLKSLKERKKIGDTLRHPTTKSVDDTVLETQTVIVESKSHDLGSRKTDLEKKSIRKRRKGF